MTLESAEQLGTFLSVIGLAAWKKWTDRKHERLLKDILHLSNGQMGEALLSRMLSARTLANLTHNAADEQLAAEAEKLFYDHQKRQSDTRTK